MKLHRLVFSFTLPFFVFSYNFDEDDDPSEKFNDGYVKKIVAEVVRLESDKKLAEIRHKIGVLGVYMRIFKELVPTNTRTGFPHLYPEPMHAFHSELGNNCLKGIEQCIDYIFDYLLPAQTWLYPDSTAVQTIELNRERMEKLINDGLLDLELSTSQILCFFSNSKISVFEYIPFCSYNMNSGNSSEKPLTWMAGLMRKNPNFFDEKVGGSFECAMKSFCPDPCCNDVDKNSLAFTERDCQLNLCKNPEKCTIVPAINDQFLGMRSNNWNISCPCGGGLTYRSDVSQCVHDNICGKRDVCPPNEQCVNIYSGKGYKCVCSLGSVRNVNGLCEEYGVSSQHWDGLARSEPHPKIAMTVQFSFVLVFTVVVFLVF